MKRALFGVALLLLCMVLAGCSRTDIIVVDGSGAPVKGATITWKTASYGGLTVTTNKKGAADLPWTVQDIWWVDVAKPGYLTATSIDVSGPKPITVVLKKQ